MSDREDDVKAAICTIVGLASEAAECQTYHIPRIAELERLLANAQEQWAAAISIIGDIEQCRSTEGEDITILCDNPEADSVETQAAVETHASFDDYDPVRYYGRTWTEALHKAANVSRINNREDEDHE